MIGTNINSTGTVGVATSTPAADLGVTGDVFISSGLGVGNATTIDGILETSGLAYIGGIIKITGSATSTFTGGLYMVV